MPRAAPIQTTFNAGELSPLVMGRVTLDQYKTGLALMLNWRPLVQGPMTRRQGTYYVTNTSLSTATRLQRFVFSSVQAYVLEFGNLYMRVYKNHAQVQAGGGGPYSLVTPYLAADVMNLKFTQSADTLYISHPNYPPAKITRTADNAWTYTVISFLDGPYLNVNTTATTFTAGATTGNTTLTASSTTGVNGGAGFTANDVGRIFRLLVGATWGWGTINSITSTTVCNVTINSTMGGTTASVNWRLGVWSIGNGYPGAVAFYSDRLYWGGCTQYPTRIDGSNSGDYENMAPTDTAGTVVSSRAVAISLNSSQEDIIRWLMDSEQGLLCGTSGGEWWISPGTTGGALTPTNVQAVRSSTYGSNTVQPVRAGKAVMYVQKANRKVREMAFLWQINGFQSPDMTLLSEHITAPGIMQMDYEQEPQSTIWMVRSDGVLVAFTYNRDQGVLGWSRHILGGFSDAGQTQPPIVTSVACIPSPAGTYDETWLVVKRYINGATVQSIEYMTKMWEHTDTQASAFCVDMGLTYTGAPTNTVSGLGYLQGQTVAILADGGPQPNVVVPPSGTITLQYAASTVTVGLPYTSTAQLMRPEAGAADGTSQGKTRRINKLILRLMDTLGLSQGPAQAPGASQAFVPDVHYGLTPLQFQQTNQTMGMAPPLFTGDEAVQFESDYDFDGFIALQATQPTPATVLSVMYQLKEEDNE